MPPSAHPASHHISTDAPRRTLDWRSSFWTLTLTLVFVGVGAALRLVFSISLPWAEALALLLGLFWRYWAHASGLWPFRIGSARYLRFSSLPQAALDALSYFILGLILCGSFDGKLTRGTVLAALVAGLSFGFFQIEAAERPQQAAD